MGEVVRPHGQGSAHGDRHGVLAHRHGHGPLRRQALRLGYQNRTRIPRFYQRDELNVPDVMQRVHWDPEFARRAGNPTTFDYGRMRETWLIHLCTDWMGDDAWLWKLDCEFRKFNFVGDTQWLSGTVTEITYLAEGDRPAVDLELTASQPAGRAHHARATPPSCWPSRAARPGAPARTARRCRRPAGAARGHQRRVRRRMSAVRVRRGAAHRAAGARARVRDRPPREAQRARPTPSWPP